MLSSLTPGSRLSENHSWLSQSALPLADRERSECLEQQGEGSGHEQLPPVSTVCTTLPQGESTLLLPTAAPAKPRTLGCLGNEQSLPFLPAC